MIFYTKSGEHQIHSNKECHALVDEQAENCDCKEISLDEAIKRKFEVCSCVCKDLGLSGRSLTVSEVKSMC